MKNVRIIKFLNLTKDNSRSYQHTAWAQQVLQNCATLIKVLT